MTMIIDNRFLKYFALISILFAIVLLLSIFIFPYVIQIHKPMTVDKIRITSIQDPNEFFKDILINNIIISFIMVMMGVVGIRWFPLIALLYNAFYLGEMISTALKPDTILYVYSIVPHAIIELPTAILAATFGYYLAIKLRELNNKSMMDYLKSKNNISNIVFKHGIMPYVTMILPLIIVSCLIESYVSLYIMRIIFNGS